MFAVMRDQVIAAEPAHQAQAEAAQVEDFPMEGQAHVAHVVRAAPPECNDIESEDDDPLPLSNDAVEQAMRYTDVLDDAIGRPVDSTHRLKRDVWLTAMMPIEFADYVTAMNED